MSTKNNIQKAIKKLEDFIEADQREGLRTLLCTFILIKVVLDEKKMSNPKLYDFSTEFIMKISAGANNWDIPTKEFDKEVRSIVNEVGDAYYSAIKEQNIHFREFIKNIGASGLGDPLGAEGRGDLSLGLLIFAEFASRFDSEIHDNVSDDLTNIIIHQIDCQEIIEPLSSVAFDFADKIEDDYESYSTK